MMKLTTSKNTPPVLANSMAMAMRRCNVVCIARWSSSMATLNDTGHCHWTSAPYRPGDCHPPWSSILAKTTSCSIVKLLSEASVQKA